MRHLIIIIGLMPFLNFNAYAQSKIETPKVCLAFEQSIEHREKNLALIFADGIADNSAVRESNRLLEKQNNWAQVEIALHLMERNGCDPIMHVINGGAYLSAALTCHNAQFISPSKNPPECDMSTWVRDK